MWSMSGGFNWFSDSYSLCDKDNSNNTMNVSQHECGLPESSRWTVNMGNLCSCRSNMLQTNKPKQNSDRLFVSPWLACSSHWMKNKNDNFATLFFPWIPILEHPHHFCMNYQLAWNHTKQSLFRDLLSLHESLFQQKNSADLLLYHSTLTFPGILFITQVSLCCEASVISLLYYPLHNKCLSMFLTALI